MPYALYPDDDGLIPPELEGLNEASLIEVWKFTAKSFINYIMFESLMSI